MSKSKRCFVCLSMVALSWSPAIFADTTSGPSAFESLIDAIVAIVVGDPGTGVAGQSGDEPEAGPNMPFIG
jgi:hypothetical protein